MTSVIISGSSLYVWTISRAVGVMLRRQALKKVINAFVRFYCEGKKAPFVVVGQFAHGLIIPQ